MKTVAIAMQKGGVGKSMLTRSIAVAAAHDGLNSAVFDMDPQQTSVMWRLRRAHLAQQLPVTDFVPELNLVDELERMRDAGCDLVVIDTPPARSSEALCAVEHADLVLIPCTPSIESYEQVHRTSKAARMAGKRSIAVLNLATPNSQTEARVSRAVFESFELEMAPVVLHRRAQHRDAGAEGLTAIDAITESKAKAEIGKLWTWLCSELSFQVNVAEGEGLR
ncbi:MAG: ParA family protein [Caulobacter sp.]|nr:ParA family protein [Caulobacter sp.]